MSSQMYSKPHQIDKEGLPPTFPQKIWRTGKKGVIKTRDFAKATSSFVKIHKRGILGTTFITAAAISGFAFGSLANPMKTNIQKFEQFAKKYSLKISNTTMAAVYGEDGKMQTLVVNGKQYYVLVDGMDPKTAGKFNDTLEKSKIKVEYRTIAAKDMVNDTTKNNVLVLLKPKSFTTFWSGKPKPTKVQKEVKSWYSDKDNEYDYHYSGQPFDHLFAKNELFEISYHVGDKTAEAWMCDIPSNGGSDRLATARFVNDLVESGFSVKTTHYPGEEISKRLEKNQRFSKLPEYEKPDNFKFKADTFFGRSMVWYWTFIFASWGINMLKIILGRRKRGP